MIRKILIATDGSEHAAKAVELGSDIAAKYGAEVVLVHVLLRHEMWRDLKRMADVEHLVADGGRPLSSIFATLPDHHLATFISNADGSAAEPGVVLERIGQELLDAAEATARDHGVVKIVKRLEDGKPVDRILALIKSEGVDLVVTGARGLSDIRALMLGSVSHKLAHLSPVTCMAIR